MKIQKYIKDKQNKYKVVIDDEDYILYDDVIVKYELIRKSEIDEKTFKEMLALNDELFSYYESIKYINRKLRSEKEIREYLHKKNIANNIIDKTIRRLTDNRFLNEEIYLKAYLTDQINLSNNGPKKIKNNLLKLGIQEHAIDEALSKITYEVWQNKIDRYIEKKIKVNHNSSSSMLKIKITNDLINLGYEREDIASILVKYEVDDRDILKKEYQKAKSALEKKYTGYELQNKIKERLYRKGFKVSNLEVLEDEK